jgi:hypothetical protein
MPLYDFENIKTGEVKELNISLSEYDDFLKENPELKRVILTAPKLGSKGTQGALSKAGDGWKEVQDRIKSGMPPKDKHRIRTK